MKAIDRCARPVLAALGAYVLSGLATEAHAQAAPAANRSNTLETVVVTARRVEEKLQDVPAAITAVTSKQLETLQPRTLQDLNGIAPNIHIGGVGAGAGAAAIYIRGLGYSDIEKGQNPAVGLLIDDVVIGTNTAQLIDAFDIVQVEVDRGPQGIFYGKNTTAGAISVHRSRPTHQWGLNADVAGGNIGQFQAQFVANAPLGDTAGAKVGLSYRKRDGFNNDIYTGNTHYGRDAYITGTVAVDWRATPQLDLLATADFAHEYGEGTPQQLGNILTAQILGPALAPLGIRFNEAGSPYIPGVTRPLGVREVANDFPDRNLLTQQRYSLNATWDSPIGQIVSITAYIHQKDDAEQDFDGSCGISQLLGKPCPVLANPLIGFLHTSRPQLYTQFTEEARVTHKFSDSLRMQAGVYYFQHKISALQLTRTGVPGVPVTAPFTQQLSGETNKSISGFANVDWTPIERLTLSVGLRYIHEKTNFHNGFDLLYIPTVGPASPPVPLVPQFRRSNSWNKLITRASIDYKLTEQNMVYASRSEGFRSGGFSPRSTLSESIPGQTNYSPGADYSAFNPETNVAYEIGSKNQFLDGQLTLNAAAFLTQDHDHQSGQVVLTGNYGPGTNTYIVNIPRVRIRGFEVEAQVRPEAIHGLTLAGSFGLQKARITNGKVPGVEAPVNANATAGAPGSVYDLTGTPLERVPEKTYQLSADYVFPVGPGEADVRAGYRWSDSYIFSTFAGKPDIQPSYGLVDATAAYSWGHYRLSISGKNLTNKNYRNNTLPVVFFQSWAEPRTWLVELQARF